MIIKQELEIEESLRKKIEFICEFTNLKPIFKNGSIRKIDKTNLIYIEPHSITIKNIKLGDNCLRTIITLVDKNPINKIAKETNVDFNIPFISLFH